MLISTGNLTAESLSGQVAVVTGAGGGIGFEAARALLWLGAGVVIAEIDKAAGSQAAGRLRDQFGPEKMLFVHTDVGDERSVTRMAQAAQRRFGQVDIVLNNATLAPLGSVLETPIEKWDASYRVNLRGPVLLARAFLPGMLARDRGVFACVSSAGGMLMGAYEVMKTAQVDLANTLDAELEGTQVIPFTIGPGYVPTRTASTSIEWLAPKLGKTIDEFLELVKAQTISPEAAGAGFAAAIVLAEQFRGQEIDSLSALLAAGIRLDEPPTTAGPALNLENLQQARALSLEVIRTLEEQAKGWDKRSLFERQWMQRSFKKYTHLTVENCLAELTALEQRLRSPSESRPPSSAVDAAANLARFYAYLYEMSKGYEKDPAKREENLRIVQGWKDDAQQLGELLESK